MAKHDLVIVESPAKAKTIGKYLGKDYEVKACMGHLRDLQKSNLSVVYIHAEFAFLQVSKMAHAGLYLIVLAQIFSNGFGLRRRLHDDQALFCHSYLRRLCSKAAFSYSDRAQERVYSVRVTARV